MGVGNQYRKSHKQRNKNTQTENRIKVMKLNVESQTNCEEKKEATFTCKELESSWNTPPLCNPENICLLSHVQPRINNYWLCPLISVQTQHINPISIPP